MTLLDKALNESYDDEESYETNDEDDESISSLGSDRNLGSMYGNEEDLERGGGMLME